MTLVTVLCGSKVDGTVQCCAHVSVFTCRRMPQTEKNGRKYSVVNGACQQQRHCKITRENPVPQRIDTFSTYKRLADLCKLCAARCCLLSNYLDHLLAYELHFSFGNKKVKILCSLMNWLQISRRMH